MMFWLAGVVFPVLLVAGVLTVVLWPTRNSGLGLLRIWGIPDPRPDQVTEAVRYLARRRLLFIVLFLVLPPTLGLVGWPDIIGTGIFMPLQLASQRINELRAGRFPDPDWFGDVMQNTGLIALVVTIACWYRVATPRRKSLAAT